MLEGEGDEYPEAGFYMMGTLEEAFEEGRRLMREAGSKWSRSLFLSILYLFYIILLAIIDDIFNIWCNNN